MHLTIQRTGGARRAGDVRGDGDAPQAIPCAPTGRLASRGPSTETGENVSAGPAPLYHPSDNGRRVVGRLCRDSHSSFFMRRSFALSAAQVLLQCLGDEGLHHAPVVGADKAQAVPERARDAGRKLGE